MDTLVFSKALPKSRAYRAIRGDQGDKCSTVSWMNELASEAVFRLSGKERTTLSEGDCRNDMNREATFVIRAYYLLVIWIDVSGTWRLAILPNWLWGVLFEVEMRAG